MRYFFLLVMFVNIGLASSQSYNKTDFLVIVDVLAPLDDRKVYKSNGLNFSFGVGAGFNFMTRLPKKIAVRYGIELALNRVNFVLNDSQTFNSFSQLKIPVLFQYSLDIDRRRKNTIDFFIGTKVIFQKGHVISGLTSSGDFSTFYFKKIGGVFPLLTFGIGYDLKLRSPYFLGIEIAYNLGLLKTLSYKYQSTYREYSYESKQTHLSLKVLFPLNARAK